MKKIYTLFSLMICMFIAGQSMAQIVNVSGDITTDTIWMDTVNVTDHIYIPDTVTLTIQPGTYIQFANRYGIAVDGGVNAIGALNDSITFIGDSAGFSTQSHIGWRGFNFDEPTSNDSSFFAYCIFEGTYSNDEDTAAIYTYEFSKLIVENSRFSYNYNGSEASCIQIEETGNSMIRNNLFTHNYSSYSCVQLGCASAGPNTSIIGNTFMYNYGTSEGSCLKISAYSHAQVVNNVFQYNYCEDNGGAIVISGYANPTLIGNLIADNYAEDMGGGISVKYYTNPIFINNTIVNNYAEGDGGGIQIGCSTTNPFFQNNIIWGNHADGYGHQLYCYDDGTTGYSFINNIVQWGMDSIYFDEPPYAGANVNMMTDLPMFADSANGDYHLTCNSPALDGGAAYFGNMPPVDLDGNQRIIGNSIDIGSFELLSHAYIASNPQNTQVMTGAVANFTVSTSYSTSFQWEESTNFGSTWSALSDNATYSGTTTNSLSINAVYTMNGYMYRCLVGGNCPGAITPSNPALLIVDYNVGIDENNNTVMVYPNPSKNNVFIQGAEGANITISDLNGRVIESRFDLGSDKEMISLFEYENGIYILRVIEDENISIIKIIKE